MTKHSFKTQDFKIGDRVQVIHPEHWAIGETIGIVIGFFEGCIVVAYGNKDGYPLEYFHLPKDIKRLLRKNEQLMLFNL